MSLRASRRAEHEQDPEGERRLLLARSCEKGSFPQLAHTGELRSARATAETGNEGRIVGAGEHEARELCDVGCDHAPRLAHEPGPRQAASLIGSPAVRARHAFSLLTAAIAVVACRGSKDAAPAPKPGASTPKPGPPRPPTAAAEAGQSRDVPTGAFRAGSTPGDPGRRPELEPRLLTVELGGFAIDRLYYPNDPSAAPRTGVSRDEAARLCSERGARLCTELEWERACKGPESDRFPTGDAWEPSCTTTPLGCASGFDVLGMGTLVREWTASDIAPGSSKPLAALRGAPRDAPGGEHRCAARTGAAPDTTAADIGFRCCHGPPNARQLPEPTLGVAYEKIRLGAERLAALLSADPITRGIAKDVKFFREPDSAETVLARGPGDKKGFSFTTTPLLWRPVPGEEVLVASGRSGDTTSFVVAFYALGGDQYRLAGSFVMKNEPGPVALAYTDDIRPRLHFSTCWGCPGETGKILFRRPERVAIVEP